MGSFEVLSDHGDTVEDDVDVDGSSEEATGIMPLLPPASWFKKTGTLKHTEMPSWEVSETLPWRPPRRRVSILFVGNESMSSATIYSKWILGNETHRGLYPV